MLTAGMVVWGYRKRLAQRELPAPNPEGKSSAFLGATITAIELPTAFPYFAAIAAIVGSGLNVAQQTLLLVVFNVCFVLPLIAIEAVIVFAPGNKAEELLGRGRRWLEARWPAVLAILALVAGVFVMFLGISGLAGQSHGHVGGSSGTCASCCTRSGLGVDPLGAALSLRHSVLRRWSRPIAESTPGVLMNWISR